MSDTCRIVRPLLDKMADGELRGRERRKMKRHLASCKTCRCALDREMELNRQLRQLPVVPCPSKVEDAICQTIRMKEPVSQIKTGKQSHDWVSWKTFSLGLAVSAAVLLILFIPAGKERPVFHSDYSAEDIQDARDQARWALSYLSQTMQEKENDAVTEIFGNTIPATLKNCLEKSMPLFHGGVK